MLLDKQSALTFSYKGLEWGEEPYNNFSVLRAKFDQWFANEATETGDIVTMKRWLRNVLWKMAV